MQKFQIPKNTEVTNSKECRNSKFQRIQKFQISKNAEIPNFKEYRNSKDEDMTTFSELENRCLLFSKGVKEYCKTIKYDVINKVYISQIIRSSASIGANYIEANEKLGPKDLLMRIKIARKESKETLFWLHHFEETAERNMLIDEAEQLRKILSAIINKLSE